MSRAADWDRKCQEIKRSIAKGNVDRLFEEEYFVLDLLKILYEETVDTSVKIELLVVLESYGGLYGGIHSASADQTIGSLLDVFNQRSSKVSDQFAFLEQVMMTVCSLIIQLDQFDTDIFRTCCQTLVSVATTGINTMETKRLRSCACQCLIQFEDWSAGCLYKDKEVLVKALKQERTDIYQDYLRLVLKIVENIICLVSVTRNSDVHTGQSNGLHVDRQYSVDPQEIRQTVSMVMDNLALFTPSGLWHIVMSLVNLVQHLPEMSPMKRCSRTPLQWSSDFDCFLIFKAMMLQEMASLNICVLHLVLYLQREFEKEVLTEDEEVQLLQRLLTAICHPSLTPAHRLFVCHWTRHHSQTFDEGEFVIPPPLADSYQLQFFPSVFDPPDCQLAKICLLNQSFHSLATTPNGVAAALLLGSVGYLHKMVWHTGSDRVAVVLFRALFQMYQRHCSKSFSQDITRFLRGLISGFPYFIPHALDFIECLRETTPDSPVYLEILSLLHQQVVTTPEEQAATYHYFYLLVLKSASLQQEISPKMTVKFLSYLAEHSIFIDDGSWLLGNSILAVCYNLLLCHPTDDLYEDVGDLLFDLMTHYRDTDVRDKSMFLYVLLTSSTDKKIQSLLKTTTGPQSFHQALSSLLPGSLGKEKGDIIEVNSPVLKWKRLKIHTALKTESLRKVDKSGDSDDNVLSLYFHQLHHSRTILTARYVVDLDGEKCKKAFAVTFHVETDDSLESINDINIPNITCEAGDQEVEMTICPTKPIPARCEAWCEFLDGKQTYRCHLEDVLLTLEDFMLPLQTHLFTSRDQESSNEEDELNNCNKQEQSANGDATDIVKMFNSLWQWCTNNNTNSDGIYSIQSVKVLPVSLSDFSNTTEKLSQYKIPCTGDAEICFGIFLPPQYHLLLKCQETNSQTLVTMATDIHQILPYVDRFLASL